MLRTVKALRYVTPLRAGGSLPAIVEADDDGLYVAKFRGAGQGHRALIAELVDPASGQAIALRHGAVGELVYTTIDRESCPLIRFRSHDHVRVSTAPCPCGRTGFRFRVLGRSDDMFIVKGINVYPLAIQDLVLGFAPVLTGEVQIILPEPPPITYDPPVRVEAGDGVDPAEFPALRDRVTVRIREILMFTPDVEVVSFGCLPKTGPTASRCGASIGPRPSTP